MDWFTKRRIRKCIDRKIAISKNDHNFSYNSKKISRISGLQKNFQEYLMNSRTAGYPVVYSDLFKLAIK